jgi:hypothetical protein
MSANLDLDPSVSHRTADDVDAILAADEGDAFDGWTLAELDGSADLAPLRSAWTGGGERFD